MSLLRRTRSETDDVDVCARLAGYEATSADGLDGRYASGYTFEPRNAGAASDVGGPGHIAAPADVPEERRGEARYALDLPVRAKSRSSDDWQGGHTVDASATGLCLEMSSLPDEAHLDVELDSTETITAWARVVGVTPVDDGVFRWRLRLVSYDATYALLLAGLDPLAEPEDPLADGLLADARSWDELLEHATA